jgi:hypothetical protein
MAVWECDHVSLPQNNWSDGCFVYSNPAVTADIFSFNTLGTGYLNCLYAYKRKSASPVLNVLSGGSKEK